MIDLTIHPEQLASTIQRCRERHIVLPTFKQMKNPELIPASIRERLKEVGLWDFNSLNLFRITWKNEPKKHGGQYGKVNHLEFPTQLTGVPARILALEGKWFPTGAHKVGASYGCLVPRLITGQFDPVTQKAVWPSTGNYCRGGAYNSHLLACDSIAILPAEMSQERFEWLKQVAGEVIATPGCESNVKEIYDKCWELRKTRGTDCVIFNQFDEQGNHLWHYEVTGNAMVEVLHEAMKPGDHFFGLCVTTGSAGTIASGDLLKEKFPGSLIAVSEALQCPTILYNGFGGHRIEGIGDKHIPWIHNVRNTDVAIGADDEDCIHLLRLFNEPAGLEYLRSQGVPEAFLAKLPLLGISGIGNMISAIKMAKYFELDGHELIFTVLTDSSELYESRLRELRQQHGEYTHDDAVRDYHRHLMGLKSDHVMELGYRERQRVHNLKYYTWVEQQGRTVEDLNAQWYDWPGYWQNIHKQADEVDRLIEDFNERTGVLKEMAVGASA